MIVEKERRRNVKTREELLQIFENADKYVKSGEIGKAILEILKWKGRATSDYLAERLRVDITDVENAIKELLASRAVKVR